MKQRKILLVDSDPKNLRILQNNFIEAHFEADQAITDPEAYKKMQEKSYDLVISEVAGPGIDGYRLLEQIQREFVDGHVPIVFLTQKSDVYNRVKSFRLGAKDYIVKPVHVKEILARVEMLLSRLEQREEEVTIAKKKFVGRLEDLSLAELIEAFGVERKTGTLSLFNENGLAGQVLFKDGSVHYAATAFLKAEDAIYKMMSWHKGRFTMLFGDIDVADEIGMSNMGLLLQGAKMMEEREELLQQLPSLEAVLITTANFKKIVAKKDLATDLEQFVALFDGERTLGRIIDESPYDEITALKRILKLYRLGFLNVLKDFSGEPTDATLLAEEPFEPVTAEMLKREEEPFPILETKTTSVEEDVPETEMVEEDEVAGSFTPWENAATEPEPIEDEEPVEEETSRESFIRPPATTFHRHSLQIDEEFVLNEAAKPEEEERIDFIPNSFVEEEAAAQEPLGPIEQVIGSEDEGEVEHFISAKTEKSADEEFGLDEPYPQNWREELRETEDFASLLDQEESVEEMMNFSEEDAVSDLVTESEWQSESSYPVEMPKNGEIKPELPVDEEEQIGCPQEADTQALFKKAKGGVLVLGTETSERRKMLEILAAGKTKVMPAPLPEYSDISYGTAEFLGGGLLNLISLTLEKEFATLIDYFSPNILGYILLVDASAADWSYYGYLIKVLRDKLRAPGMIVIQARNGKTELYDLATMRKKLSLRDGENIQICGELDQILAKRIIFTLFESYTKKRKEAPSAESQLVTSAK